MINVSYMNDPHKEVGCSLGSAVGGVEMTVHLPFADFSALLTHKLIQQLEMLEADTVVEAMAQNVTCVFWPRENIKDQDPSGVDQSYQLQEFRQSNVLQKRQSQARALVPITEADTDQEEFSHIGTRSP